MFFKRTNPTDEQLREAHDMLAELGQLFEAGREKAYAAEIRKALAGGTAAEEAWLTSGNLWGGMGSILDNAFGIPSGLGWDVDCRNRRELMKIMIKLGRHQLASGILKGNIKRHIEDWI